MNKRILGIFIAIALSYVAKSQDVLVPSSVFVTKHLRFPADTVLAPIYINEIRYNTADGKLYQAQNFTGAKWAAITSTGGGGGGGATPSLNAVRLVNDTVQGTIVHDTTMTGNPLEKLWAKYMPLEKTDTAVTPFYEWQFAGTNNGQYNEVMMKGWNLNSGGGSIEAHKPALGESWESNYQIDPSGHGHRYVEKHEIYVDRDGVQHRLGSYTIDADTRTISFYHTSDNFDLHGSVNHTPYFSVFNSTHLTNMSMVKQDDQAQYYNIAAEFAESSTASSFAISSPGNKPSRTFKLVGFNNARLPESIEVFDEHNSSSIITMKDSAGTLLSAWQGGPSNTLFFTPSSSGKYISFAPEQVSTFNLYSTNTASNVPLYVGSGTYSGSNKAVIDNGDKAVSLRLNNFNGSGGTQYGLSSIVSGGGSGTNIGAYIWGFNNSSQNINLRLGPTNVSSGNYMIYSDGTAASHLPGWFSMGPNPVEYPHATLEVYGQAMIDTLTNGSSTDSFVVAHNNLLKKVAPPGPGGSNTYVQFNNSGVLGGSAGLTWDNTNNVLTLTSSNGGMTSTTTSGGAYQGFSQSSFGGFFQSYSGISIEGQIYPSTTNTVTKNLVLDVESLTGNTTAGFGQSIDFQGQANGTSSMLANRIVSTYTSIPTAGTRVSQLEFWGVNSGTSARKFAIAGSGKLTADGYGSGAQTGTPTGVLGVTSSGDFVEMGNIISGSATLDFASTNAQNSSDLTISVTGAADGDPVSLGVPNAAVNANSCYTAWVSATNTVTVRFNNYSSGAINPASATFKIKVLK